MKHKDYFNGANQGLASFGQFGLRLLNAEASIENETFVAIQVLTDAVITSKLKPYPTPDSEIIGDTDLTSLALTAGTIIYGRFYDVDVESGKVIAYKG
jgi:hypothetical protein